MAATLRRHGRIDVLHNSAGVASVGGPVELDEAAWSRTIATNPERVFLACKHALPSMLRPPKGKARLTGSGEVASDDRSDITDVCVPVECGLACRAT